MNREELGFTLVEVLIASAIVMLSMGVLLQLFGSGLDRIQRAGQTAHLLTVQRVIMHTFESINPAIQSEGKAESEGLSYTWKASLREPFRPLRGSEAYIKREIALFTISISVKTMRGKEYSFNFDQLGWRDVQ